MLVTGSKSLLESKGNANEKDSAQKQKTTPLIPSLRSPMKKLRGDEPSTPSTLLRKLSKIFSPDGTQNQDELSFTEEMRKLELGLEKKEFSQVIVEVVNQHNESLIRFLLAYNEWKSTKSKSSRRQIGRKILATYFKVCTL